VHSSVLPCCSERASQPATLHLALSAYPSSLAHLRRLAPLSVFAFPSRAPHASRCISTLVSDVLIQQHHRVWPARGRDPRAKACLERMVML
jgi:hypothetical protein